MDYSVNENTLRYLKKKQKDWSVEKIEVEAKKVLDKYFQDNSESLEKLEMKNKKVFEQSVDKDFMNLLTKLN
ncbi:hypothetical protein JBL43_05335 [Aureibaculum sp. A20]|uniref:CopG family transcriptional regulator n=1 Tax=Aureibaculum flavum TaxID=2795986 RepID=A0ABS0WNU3_9FLAO|nr:hypothetical protein [Aureibaculum flavum]MBJ2173650.1 hypothetical protein [Aureibaculum flavum]